MATPHDTTEAKIRDLERLVAQGDHSAKARLERLQERAQTPEAVERARLRDEAGRLGALIRRHVEDVQPGARQRTVDADSVVLAVLRVAQGSGDWFSEGDEDRPHVGYWTSGRERVASSYGYTARATCVDVMRVGNMICVSADRVTCGSVSPLGLTSIQSRWREETIRRRMVPATGPGVVTISVDVALYLAEDEAIGEEVTRG